jgi:hypothetical protein
MKNKIMMDELILFHKLNKKRSEKMMDFHAPLRKSEKHS